MEGEKGEKMREKEEKNEEKGKEREFYASTIKSDVLGSVCLQSIIFKTFFPLFSYTFQWEKG